jgi:Notch-like protein
MDIIDCDSESCSNNGTCIELMNGFACQCLPNFDGSRCQYRRTKNDNHCKKICLNNGKCVLINNRERCSCLSKYYGSQCEHIRDNNSLSSIPKCSLLKFRNSNNKATCLAIGLTPLFDVHCECHHDDVNKQFVDCQITPTPYSSKIYLI